MALLRMLRTASLPPNGLCNESCTSKLRMVLVGTEASIQAVTACQRPALLWQGKRLATVQWQCCALGHDTVSMRC